MKSGLIFAAAITAVTSQFSPAQNAPATLPSSTTAEPGDVAATTGTIQFRALPAVLDARERRQDWHQAAQHAADRIQDPALKSQFNQRLAGLVPMIAKALMAQPQEDALVTVAVYRDPAKPANHAMVAVTFDGLGGQIGQTFFADVIAGMPKVPDAEGVPKSLTLDTEATSYLVFFLGKNQLLAGDIPHPVMGRSVVAMINRQRETDRRGAGAVAVAPGAGSAPRQSPTAPPQDPSHPEIGSLQPYGGYIDTGAYAPVNDGYYYPSAVGVPIVILPGEFPSSPDYLARQRARQKELERHYQQNADTPNGNHSNTAQSPNYNTPRSGNSVTPQSGNSVAPQSGNSVAPQSGNSANPQTGNRPSGPTQFPRAGEPGGPPANKNAPQQPANGTPPAGAPGGPPAQSGKK
jgi:hypothetical protein